MTAKLLNNNSNIAICLIRYQYVTCRNEKVLHIIMASYFLQIAKKKESRSNQFHGPQPDMAWPNWFLKHAV